MRKGLVHKASFGFCAAVLVALVLSISFVLISSFAVAEDKIISIDSEDAEMNAAIEKARNSLEGFWQKFSNPGPTENMFMVKVRLTDGTQVEHFWCSKLEGSVQSATCAIDNDPQSVKTVVIGQRITVEPKNISDWMYLRDGKIVGGSTIRVLLKYLPPEEADDLRARLAEE